MHLHAPACTAAASRRGVVLLLEFANPISTKLLVGMLVLAMIASVVILVRVEYRDNPDYYYQ